MDHETLSWTVGCSLMLFVGLFIAVIVYVIKICNQPMRKRMRREWAQRRFAAKEKKFLKSVNLDGMKIPEFPSQYEKRLKHDFLFKEFNALLSRYRVKPLSVKAQLKKNEGKNLFEDHIPFEENIVNIGSRQSEYINASWIKGIGTEKMYIITQIPLNTTIVDFWKMIWMHNCSIIVMISGEVLNDEIIMDYLNPSEYKLSPFSLTVKKKILYSDFVKRLICLHNKKSTKEIVHFQFLTWKHNEFPNPEVILELRKQMTNEWFHLKGPPVFHCISGCGNSGTLVAIIKLCDMVDNIKSNRSEEKLSIPYVVIDMRESRFMSVANLRQYSLIYETITHYIVGGITSFPLYNMESEMQYLSIKSSLTGLTGFQRQFENTNKRTKALKIVDCSGGIRIENREKNRIYHVVPRDCNRPYLENICLPNTSDYINAVYVDSFNSRNHFLVTQWPKVNTANDIWRLFYNHRIHVAVLVDDFQNDKNYPIFWLNTLNQSIGCGTLAVKLIKDSYVINSIRCQVFQITKIKFQLKESEICLLKARNVRVKPTVNLPPWEITFFLLLNWKINKAIPDNLENVIDLICLAEEYNSVKCRLQKTLNCPILILSKDGIERAGVLCVLAFCLNNVKHCGEIDIYNSVICTKRNRPELIPTIEEYLLCYELCLEYLKMNIGKRDFQEKEDMDIKDN